MLRVRGQYDEKAVSDAAAVVCGPGRTKQSFKDECDINVLVRRFGLTGQFPVPSRLPRYEDYSEVSDFKTAMDAVCDARERFMELPARVRREFQNDPQELLAFVADEKNRERAIELGLVAKPAPPGSSNLSDSAAPGSGSGSGSPGGDAAG